MAGTFAVVPFGNTQALAADYAATLKSKGFPDSYIPALVELHEKYPNWIFEPFDTGLTWSTAVSGERSTHSKQLIEKYSGNSSDMYCSCSSCYKNGSYVIQEASNWVSASQKAVEYYMDPRNFLNEEGIFQFESTEYNGTQSQSGVESILKGTWMYNSVISYKDANGVTKSFTSKKYSDAIMAAANDFGMSAYYLASKIVQEVGGASPTAGGASGTNSTYPGIYNYYNIGAYTGATDGLKWASTSTKGYYTNCSCYLRKSATTSSTALVLLPSGTSVTYKSTTATQGDGYKWYNVSVTYNSTTYTGYIRSDLVDYSSSDTYNRPWYTPYLTIYNGAKYISTNFKTQFTGYLQKFNVNSASGSLYSHEYMANVAAAAAESATTYKAYKNANILSMTKTFSIPVFNDMVNDDISVDKVQSLKASGNDSVSVTLKWNAVSNATGYQVQLYRGGKWVTFGTTKSTTLRVNTLSNLCVYYFRVRAYRTYDGKNYYGSYSDKITAGTRGYITDFTGTSKNTSSVTLSWAKNAKATNYRIYIYNSSKGAYELYKDVNSDTTSLTVTGLKSGTSYKFKMYGYRTVSGVTYATYTTDPVTVKVSGSTAISVDKVQSLKASGNDSVSVTLKWNAVSNATGYQVQLYRGGKWVTFGTTKSTTLRVNTLSNLCVYYFRVRAYRTYDGKNYYGSYSDKITAGTRGYITDFTGTSKNTSSVTLSWAKNAKATNYRIYIYNSSKGAYELYKDVNSDTTSLTVTGLKSGTSYKFKMYGYRTVSGVTYATYTTDPVTVKVS